LQSYYKINTNKDETQISNKSLYFLRLAAASDKAYQLLDHGRHDIAEILLKEALKYLIVCISMTVNCYDNSKYECNKLFAKFFLDSAFYTAHVKISQHLNSSKIQSQNGSKWIPITHINLTSHISALVQKNSLDGVNIPS
jgi:hypothetical protein